MRGFRVGVIGPRSPFGHRVRELLGDGALPVRELKLFETDVAAEATLSEFGDEVVVTQPLDVDVLPHLDVVFVAGEDSDVLNRVAREAADAGVLTLVSGAVGLEAPLLTADRALGPSERMGIVPRFPSYLVGLTLERITRSFALTGAAATILLPAHEWGASGIEELHQQVVHLLNFKPVPTEVFSEQVAFNARVARSRASETVLAEAVAREAAVLAKAEGAVTVSLVQVSVFHGYAASIWVELDGPADEKALSASFRGAPFRVSRERARPLPSPAALAESRELHVGPARFSDNAGRPGLWLWVVGASGAYDPAETAVEAAKTSLS